MEILNKVYYHQLEKVKDILKVKEIFCIQVFQEWLSEEEIEKIKMDQFLTVWRKNFDWYFSEDNWYSNIEKFENIYFSKYDLKDKKIKFLDFIDELELYIFIEK